MTSLGKTSEVKRLCLISGIGKHSSYPTCEQVILRVKVSEIHTSLPIEFLWGTSVSTTAS